MFFPYILSFLPHLYKESAAAVCALTTHSSSVHGPIFTLQCIYIARCVPVYVFISYFAYIKFEVFDRIVRIMSYTEAIYMWLQ